MKNKIGVGIITCNREEYLVKCVESLPNVDELVIVNDGTMYSDSIYPDNATIIQNNTNKGIGISKNKALRHLMQADCEHLFLIEDDMLILRDDIFTHYIKSAQESGIWHLSFAYHGDGNRNSDGTPTPRQLVEYDNDVIISLNPNAVGSFTYFHRGVIKAVGYLDEHYINAWEHIDHTYKIIKAGLHPPFWWFADAGNSTTYITEQDGSFVDSARGKDQMLGKKTVEGMEWFKHVHGCYPTQIPNATTEQVMKELVILEDRYKRKVI